MHSAAIEIQQLYKRYGDGEPVISGIDLRIPQGAFFGLLGRNGAGKSTLIGLISGLLNMQQGKIFVQGFDNQRQAMRARLCVGVVPQEVNFNSFEPVREIIESQAMYYGLSLKKSRQRSAELLDKVGLSHRADKKAWGLSGGMKRRLMLARALVHQPQVLILDEPSAGLDVEARQQTWALLKDLNRDGTTILLTTHYLEEAESLCRDIAIIDEGKIIARDAPQKLLSGLQSRKLTLNLHREIAGPPVLNDGQLLAWRAMELEVDWPLKLPLAPLFEKLSEQGVEVASVQDGGKRLESRFLELLAADQQVVK